LFESFIVLEINAAISLEAQATWSCDR